ncbi:DUF1661 domain-containing protein [Porphyromonas gingivalis]|uniref:DUF1661 domain-containing protein n=1 Tax=Porphyromonas gingivalis TaxID=837 RepID=A0AAE9XJE3_PORGN|nr:DUF1661 domain-containing protein [Porphyromonas gingivalis]WCG04226.1 DUF1661 domain-containing protein [Porphyromonas gingivalis]
MAREVKNLRAKTKKISRHFFRKYERQSEHFSLVILEAVSINIKPRDQFSSINVYKPYHLSLPNFKFPVNISPYSDGLIAFGGKTKHPALSWEE